MLPDMASRGLDNRRKLKCSVFTTEQFFNIWIWCILLYYFVSLPCVLSNCLHTNITVAVYPQGDISVPYGSPLEIYCIAENYSSSDIEFSLAGKILPSEIVNTTTRRLYIKHPEKQANTYYCKNNKTRKICLNRVLVDSPPTNVSDFSCWSKNLDELNCTWEAPVSNSYINYSLTFIINGNTVQPCYGEKIEKDSNTYYCKWNTSSQPRYRQQEDEYYFNLRSCNVFGCHEQNITIDHFSVVKPDAPSGLKVIRNETHSVELQWRIPNNMVDLLPCGLDHKIEYQIAKIDNTAYFRSVDASHLPPNNKTYRLKLANLPYAHMQYEVRVYIKSKKATKDKFWSDFSYIVFYTASEKPNRPPETTAGAFHQATFNNKRVIYVYWKQLEEYEEAGANFTYKVVVSQDNKKNTLFPDKNKSLSYVVLNGASLGAIDVSVWSYNSNGSSLNSSQLYIPPKRETNSLTLSSFTKLAYENGTYELSWAGDHRIDNYTLFWCQHNTTKICTGRMNFTTLDPHKNSHVIDLPRDYRYQFAISVNNGTKTSGMLWAKCDISKDGIAMYGFPVHLDYDAPGKSFVQLRWSMDCTLQNGTITGYSITYCPVIRTSTMCDNSVGNQSVYIDDPKKMYYNITNLLPFRTYQFTIALNTTYGLKTIENTTAVITTSEDTPTSPRKVTISEISNDSFVVSWDPPLHRNGNIGKYVINNYGKEIKVDNVPSTDVSRRKVRISNLQSFANYSITVQACNIPIGLCSKVIPNDAIFVRTRIGPPGRLKAPTIRNNPDMLLWEPPTIASGTVDLFQVKRVKDNSDPEILNTTNLSFSLIYCDGVSVAETYQVRAINFDEDPNFGVLADSMNVILPTRQGNNTQDEYPGEWSEPSTVACRSRDRLTMILIFISVFVIIGMGYGSMELYKKYRKMEDIKPVLPNGLGEPEKDMSKYTFGGWNPAGEKEKPPSDEVLLLPGTKSTVTSSDIKQKDGDNCCASDHTDSTALSDSSRAATERQASTSDDGSNSSLRLDVEQIKTDDASTVQLEDEITRSDIDSSPTESPYLDNNSFKKNPISGYVQSVGSPRSGYVQSTPASLPHAPMSQAQPTSSSYVMASLPPQIFTTGVAPPNIPKQVPARSGYVLPEDVQIRPTINLPKLGTSPTKMYGSESLPAMPILPPQTKPSADSNYIQLQSLHNLKPAVRNTVPVKPAASSGYVSPGDAVINKHLNNILSAGQLTQESAILDPAMSPDAYCRFSWSTDPANDNLHSLLAESPTTNTPSHY